MEPDFEPALAAFVLAIAAFLRRRPQQRRGVSPLLQTRNTLGQFQTEFLPRFHSTDPKVLRDYIRLSPANFSRLLQLVRPFLSANNLRGRPSLEPSLKLAFTLRFLAVGCTQTEMAINYKVGRSTAHKVLSEVLPAIYSALQPLYLRKPCAADWRESAMHFESRWNAPLCCGAVDGKHITLICPSNSGSAYYNYKVSLSLIDVDINVFNATSSF